MSKPELHNFLQNNVDLFVQSDAGHQLNIIFIVTYRTYPNDFPFCSRYYLFPKILQVPPEKILNKEPTRV